MDKSDASTEIEDGKVEVASTSLSQHTLHSDNADSTNVCCTNVEPVDNQQVTSESEHAATIPAEPSTSQLEPRDPNVLSSDSNFAQNVGKEDSLKTDCSADELHVVVQEETRLQTMNLEEPLTESETVPSEIANQTIPLVFASTPLDCSVQVPNINENVLTESQENAAIKTVQRHELPNLSPTVVNTGEACCSTLVQPVMAIDSPHIQQCLNASGLSLLASQYDSESDSDDVCEVPATQSYQNRVVEIDSDSSTDVEVTGEDRDHIDLEILTSGHGEEDDEENIRNSRPLKVKGELQFEDLPPIQDLHITVPEEECTELGQIQSIVEQLVLINSLPGTVPLDLETVLFLDKGKQVLGEIFDVLGQVSDPMYCVRFNSNKSIKEKGIEVGQMVYVAPRTQHTQFIVLANLMKVRGSDASWENDVEPPPRFIDYSDDEEEREARRPSRNRNPPMDTEHEAPKRHRFGGGFLPSRPFRGNYHAPPREPRYQPPSNYDIAGNSWHSNYYQNYVHPQQYHQHYQMPAHHHNFSAPPPPVTNHAMVLNPYAVFPPPPLMQQPLFPPQHAPPPPGGF